MTRQRELLVRHKKADVSRTNLAWANNRDLSKLKTASRSLMRSLLKAKESQKRLEPQATSSTNSRKIPTEMYSQQTMMIYGTS